MASKINMDKVGEQHTNKRCNRKKKFINILVATKATEYNMSPRRKRL